MKTLNHLALCAVLAVAGCGETDTGGRVAVTGHITFQGKPLAAGRINFTPAKGNSGLAAGGEIQEGQFRIRAAQGPTEGQYQVTVTTGVLRKDMTIGVDPADKLPLQQQEQQTFQFSRTITPDSDNVLDFDLLP